MSEEDTGLGLGLNALFDEEEGKDLISEEISAIEEKIQNEPDNIRKRLIVGVEQLYPSRFQPRQLFDDDTLNDLAESIKQYGILQPLLVREDPDNEGCYEIIAGERRWRAAQKAQIHEVPIIILNIDEIEAFKIALIENLQREDLNPLDEALGYQRLLDKFGQTQEELAKVIGRSRSHIANMLRMLKLPQNVQLHLSNGELSMGHVRTLITVDNPEELAKEILAKKLSVRQAEKLVANRKGTEQQKRPRNNSKTNNGNDLVNTVKKDEDTLALERDMSNVLGMNVSIDSSDGHSGKISIEFKTLDQLDEILHRLARFPNSCLDG